MTPAEVIAMRDKLASDIEDVYIYGGSEPSDVADALIESGWVTNEPERKDDEN